MEICYNELVKADIRNLLCYLLEPSSCYCNASFHPPFMPLRTADYTIKKSCGMYEIKNENKRLSYKIFVNIVDVESYFEKNKDKLCESMEPVFTVYGYKEYKNMQVQKLTLDKIQKYLAER